MKKLIYITTIIIFLLSCEQAAEEQKIIKTPEKEPEKKPEITYPIVELVECPDYIAQAALDYAILYSQAETEYSWGGQDHLRSIKIDCSGLVVNCYLYATNGTPYALPFYDAAVIHFFTQWSVPTLDPRPGDMIFTGINKDRPTHMCIYIREDEENIYFIDSNILPNENVNGVSERFYSKKDYSRFISFGRLLVTKR